MLTTLTRKLCPLMTLAIATIGCGKKISDQDSQPARQTENQELPAAFVIKLDGSADGPRKMFSMPRSATFNIPDRLQIKEGSVTGKSVELAFDVNPYDQDDYEYKCSYLPSAGEMVLSRCVDYDGQDYGDVSGEEFRLYQNDQIQMKINGSPSEVVVEAIFSMRWF